MLTDLQQSFKIVETKCLANRRDCRENVRHDLSQERLIDATLINQNVCYNCHGLSLFESEVSLRHTVRYTFAQQLSQRLKIREISDDSL